MTKRDARHICPFTEAELDAAPSLLTPEDQADHARCGEYWSWLYEERRRLGHEPSLEAKRARINA